MIKPDGVAGNYTYFIRNTILASGFTIHKEFTLHLHRDTAKGFYADHSTKSFFPTLINYITRYLYPPPPPNMLLLLFFFKLFITCCPLNFITILLCLCHYFWLQKHITNFTMYQWSRVDNGIGEGECCIRLACFDRTY